MSQRLQILIVEDNLGDAELLTMELKRAGFDFEWKRVETKEDFLAQLHPGLDLILSDYDLPQFSGLEALELLRQSPQADIPFIIVSGTIGEDTAVKAIQRGAADYLLKDRIARLGPAVQRVLISREEFRSKKLLEAQFIESQKMEVLGRLAAGVAHDFNNVLVVILCYSDLMIQDLSADDPLFAYAEEVRVAAQRAAGLTQQLLMFSRKESVQVVPLDLNAVVEGMDKMIHRLVDEDVELKIVPGDQVGPIMGNSGYIWQLMMNLVVNARDAMLQGGKIIIETSADFLDEAFVRAHPGVAVGEYAKLSISDTGNGMSDEVKARLFEPFFTTKPSGKGTGLGLVTCQTIVRQCGGFIDVSSRPGQGTRFDIYFPRIEAPPEQEAASSVKTGRLKMGTEVIMVVEDEPSLRHLAKGVLQAQGYQVLTASNGQDALRVAREHKGPSISLVMTDVVMPRMGGKIMAEWLKTTYPDLKILFTSGYTEDAIAHHGVLDEGVEFLPKPYTRKTLVKKVRKLLDS